MSEFWPEVDKRSFLRMHTAVTTPLNIARRCYNPQFWKRCTYCDQHCTTFTVKVTLYARASERPFSCQWWLQHCSCCCCCFVVQQPLDHLHLDLHLDLVHLVQVRVVHLEYIGITSVINTIHNFTFENGKGYVTLTVCLCVCVRENNTERWGRISTKFPQPI